MGIELGTALAIGSVVGGLTSIYQAHQQSKAQKAASALQMQSLGIQQEANEIQRQGLQSQIMAAETQAQASQAQMLANQQAQKTAEESATRAAQQQERANKQTVNAAALLADTRAKERDPYYTSPWGDQNMNARIKTLGAYDDEEL